MNEPEFNKEFSRLLGKLMMLLEVSNNEHLKKEVKSSLFDFSDKVKEINTRERHTNGTNFNR